MYGVVNGFCFLSITRRPRLNYFKNEEQALHALNLQDDSLCAIVTPQSSPLVDIHLMNLLARKRSTVLFKSSASTNGLRSKCSLGVPGTNPLVKHERTNSSCPMTSRRENA